MKEPGNRSEEDRPMKQEQGVDADAAMRRAAEAITRASPHVKHREDVAEVCYDWCPRCLLDEIAMRIGEIASCVAAKDAEIAALNRILEPICHCGSRLSDGHEGHSFTAMDTWESMSQRIAELEAQLATAREKGGE